MRPHAAKIALRSLRLSLRFVLPLAAAIALLAYVTVPLVDQLTLRWFVRDLDIRSHLIASTLQDPLAELLEQDNKARINRLLQRSIQDERLFALGYCNNEGKLLYRTSTFPSSLGCTMPASATPRSKIDDPVAAGTGSRCHNPHRTGRRKDRLTRTRPRHELR